MYSFRDIPEIELSAGCHLDRSAGLCFMEMVAWFAGEEHSARPACSCPILGAYGIVLNDRMNTNNRTRLLKPLVPLMVGTKDRNLVQTRTDYLIANAANAFPKLFPDIVFDEVSTHEEVWAAMNYVIATVRNNSSANRFCYQVMHANNNRLRCHETVSMIARAIGGLANGYTGEMREKVWKIAVDGLIGAINLNRPKNNSHEGEMFAKMEVEHA